MRGLEAVELSFEPPLYPEKNGTRVMHGKNGVDAISLIEPTMHPKREEDTRFQVTERPQARQVVTAPTGDILAPHGKLIKKCITNLRNTKNLMS